MKNLYIAISIIILNFSASAQTKETAKADKLFARFEYVKAVKEYLKLTDNGTKDPYVFKQLGDSYYNMFNSTEAVKWYKFAVEKSQDGETLFRYAEMLKANGKYDEANKQMQKFAQLLPNDKRAKAFNQNPNYIPKLLDQAKLYNVKTSEISSDKSDFGAILYDKSLYFVSARNGARKNYGWTGEPFLDIYKADYNDDGTITNPQAVAELNSKWHEGPVSLNADGKTIYFSSESYKEKVAENDKKMHVKFSQIYLFKATKVNDAWSQITALPFNDKTFSNSNPSLSRDGKTLYFSSNRPGSIGGNDIWKVSVNSDGTYGEPQNLGDKVNTEADESFPFISDDNKTLFFSSNGKQGFGGLDVFQIDLAAGNPATNVGKPVNSEKDDFGFTFNVAKKIGFFASNRNGNDDIFIATPVCGVDVTIVVTDSKTGLILPKASVSILDDRKNIIASETSNDKGEVKYRVECDRAYVVQASKDGYEGNTFAINKTNEPTNKVDAPLQPLDVIITEKEVILNPIFFEFDKSNITQQGAFELDKLVQVMKQNEKMVILAKSHTDNRGTDAYNLALSERRANATVQYVISKGISENRISGKGMGKLEPKVDCGEQCTEEQHATNRRSEFLIVK